MKKYYVYELVNQEGKVEYVGCSYRPKERMKDHLKKPSNSNKGNGKFYGRTDLKMNIVKSFVDKKEARLFEGKHKINNGFEWTEALNGKKYGKYVGIKYCSKPINVYCEKTNKFIGYFYSKNEACRKLNLNAGQVYRVLNNIAKSTKGYKIEYA